MPESMMQPDLQDIAPVQGVRASALARWQERGWPGQKRKHGGLPGWRRSINYRCGRPMPACRRGCRILRLLACQRRRM